jgi:hypothetical protein
MFLIVAARSMYGKCAQVFTEEEEGIAAAARPRKRITELLKKTSALTRADEPASWELHFLRSPVEFLESATEPGRVGVGDTFAGRALDTEVPLFAYVLSPWCRPSCLATKNRRSPPSLRSA